MQLNEFERSIEAVRSRTLAFRPCCRRSVQPLCAKSNSDAQDARRETVQASLTMHLCVPPRTAARRRRRASDDGGALSCTQARAHTCKILRARINSVRRRSRDAAPNQRRASYGRASWLVAQLLFSHAMTAVHPILGLLLSFLLHAVLPDPQAPSRRRRPARRRRPESSFVLAGHLLWPKILRASPRQS